MGYQESVIPVKNLSEVVGISRAIEEFEEKGTLEYLLCFCAARARKPIFSGYWFGRPLSDVSDFEEPIINEGDLFAVVGGSRFYQYGSCIWIDCLAGIDEGYETLFEDIPLNAVNEQCDVNLLLAKAAESKMRQHLNRVYEAAMHEDDSIELPTS